MSTTSSYKPGELYLFTHQQTRHRIWGLFETTDPEGNILLESATDDFETFRLHVVLPKDYTLTHTASRSELRDFAYNMGFHHI